MAATTSTGYLPTAVSADSMTASVPSSTALATSKTSARVGIELLIMDSIIWVAVMTRRSILRALEMSDFWIPISCASPTSTPRSPRATIMPDAARSMLLRVSSSATTSARSILAMIAGFSRCCASNSLVWVISPALETNDTATKSGRTSARLLMSVRSLAVRAGAASPPPRRLMPLREPSLPPTTTVQSTALVSTSSTRRRMRPSSSNRMSPRNTLLHRAS